MKRNLLAQESLLEGGKCQLHYYRLKVFYHGKSHFNMAFSPKIFSTAIKGVLTGSVVHIMNSVKSLT